MSVRVCVHVLGVGECVRGACSRARTLVCVCMCVCVVCVCVCVCVCVRTHVCASVFSFMMDRWMDG